MDLNKNSLKGNYLPIIVGVALFLVITMAYFSPMLEGKKIRASDAVQFKGMSKEIVDYRNKTGKEALWTNGMFSGMPAVQVSITYSKNLMKKANDIIHLGLGTPARQVFMYMLGFFILLLVLRVNPWLSIAGAIAFAFSSYFFIILAPGHNSKAAVIGYMAPVLAGIILTFRGKYFAGALLTAFFLSLGILKNHPQIIYYLMIMVIIYGVVEFINHYKNKQLASFFQATGLLLIASLLAVLTNISSLWGTYEYSKYSIRGKTELTTEKENRTSGLDKDYATSWSYGKLETMTLLIPDIYGGSSNGALTKNSETYRLLQDNRVPNASNIIKQLPLYWGPQPFTSGPVYVGAIVIFLFVLSLFIVKGPLKWWAVSVTILSIILAWGKNFMWLTNLFLDYFPLYNKFRTVSMILVMAELSIPLLAILGVQKILEKKIEKKTLLRYGKYSLYITGGILLFFILFGSSILSFSSENDKASGIPDWLITAFRDDRISLFRTDAIRSLVFILLAAALLWAFVEDKIKKTHVLILLPVLFLADMWPVNKRYLNNDNFVKSSTLENPYTPTKADQSIEKDKTLYYRVFNLTEPLDKSARTSYFFKNIGGYHGAKLRRYQEMIDMPLAKERSELVSTLSNKSTLGSIDRTLKKLPALGMLNTRYIIYNNNADALQNPYALGNAWFVNDVKVVQNADEEIGALESLKPDSIAVADKRFETYLQSHPFQKTSTGKINLTNYTPNTLDYDYDSPADQFAVFSEVYYPKGWTAYIDGKETPFIRVNYILRGMVLPSGQHKIEFRYRPKFYFVGQNIMLVSSLFLYLLIASYFYQLWYQYRKKSKEKANQPA